MDLSRAVEIAVDVFAADKRRTHPFAARLVDGLWLCHDDPPKKNPRKAQVFALDDDPSRIIDAAQPLGWHFITDVVSPGADLAERKAAYKALGYRAMTTDWFMVHDLTDIPELDSNPPARWVQTQQEWTVIPQESSQQRRWIEGIRQYCTWDETVAYGWVSSRPYGDLAWTNDLYVRHDNRRSGFGRALMSRLLRDDREQGSTANGLIASAAGLKLYETLGYSEIGALQVFCPLQRSSG